MQLHELIGDLADRAGPGVVGLAEGARGGSGVVVAPRRVLTLTRNLRREHVAVVFADGRREQANALGSDPDVGVALLEVDTGEAPLAVWPDSPKQAAIGSP